METKPGNKRAGMCPKCQNKLYGRKLGRSDIKVDVCPGCRGMWFEQGELQEHSAVVEGKLIPPADTEISRRLCPCCGVVMSAFKYSGTEVQIDLCEECRGVWLDQGEFKRIEGAGMEESGGFLSFLGDVFADLID